VSSPRKSSVAQERLPLQELGALLIPAAEAAELTEEELLDCARQVRRRLWRERYDHAVQGLARPSGTVSSGGCC
jgi:hypothetical protein